MENETNHLTSESRELCSEIVRRSLHNVQEQYIIDQCAEQANLIVDNLINKLSQTPLHNEKPMEVLNKDESHWLTIEEFTVENGKNKIEEFIQTWKRNESWLYYIAFLCEDEYKCSKRYRYKVQWSIPTRRKPIPRATASVYFTIEVSTVKPKHFPCQVYFIFETNKLVHRPGHTLFREKWLKDIIESKIIMMESVTF